MKFKLLILSLLFTSNVYADCIDEIVKFRATGQGDLKTADCFHKNKLYSESLPLLTTLAENDAESLEYLLDKLPSGYESIVESFLSRIKPKKLNKKTYGDFIYWRAKGLNRKEKYKSVLALTNDFDRNHPKFPFILFFRGVAFVNLGKISSAESSFIESKNLISKIKVKSNKELFLNDLASSSLSKIYLTQKKYSQAELQYKEINSESVIWYDNLIELGWNQLSSRNFSQALGNMYFVDKNTSPTAWKPDSYLIRAMAFLSLCHFPDADDALKVVEKYYKALYVASMEAQKKKVNFYNLLVESLNMDPQSFVSGYPVPLIRYAAIDIDFIQVQESINNLIDELTAQRKLENKIAKRVGHYEKDKMKNIDAVARLKEEIYKLKSKKASSDKISKKEEELKQAQNELLAIDTGINTLNSGVSFHIAKLNQKIESLESLKSRAIVNAEKVLDKKVSTSLKQLKEKLDQAELIRFEIFSRSGNNIRFRLAGGKISEKDSKTAFKAFGTKELKWDFNGEIWKDEYGSLDTSIKDMCKTVEQK
jgi:hypothetical protein